MWHYENDGTAPIITAQKHIKSSHGGKLHLPELAVLFYMHGGVEYVVSHYETEWISDRFPRFLNACPIYKFSHYDLCFLDGGRGAPQAADTMETLHAFGVRYVITVGMFGAFANDVHIGDIIVPNKAFVEEGTSLHYYSSIDFAAPDEKLRIKAAASINGAKSLPIVSTDAVYRQTFFKENLWRKQGAVGVDMETSALFSVGKALGMNVVSILIASDKHPLTENEPEWKWSMRSKKRYAFFDQCLNFALHVHDLP